MSEVVFSGGRFCTLEPSYPLVEAIAVRDGRIAATGRTDDLLDRFPRARRFDLRGLTAVPGFIDSHMHLASYGIALRRIDLTPAR